MRNFAPAGNGPVPSCLPLPFELDESEDFADQDAGLPAGDTGSDIISLTSAEPSNSRWDNAFISPNDLAKQCSLQLISSVAAKINADPIVDGLLKVYLSYSFELMISSITPY